MSARNLKQNAWKFYLDNMCHICDILSLTNYLYTARHALFKNIFWCVGTFQKSTKQIILNNFPQKVFFYLFIIFYYKNKRFSVFSIKKQVAVSFPLFFQFFPITCSLLCAQFGNVQNTHIFLQHFIARQPISDVNLKIACNILKNFMCGLLYILS